MSLISFQDVTVNKYQSTILSQVNWCLKRGENWAIIGPNGSGKTILLDVIAAKWFVQAGSIKYNLAKSTRESIELVSNDYSFNRIVSAGAEYYQQRFYAYESERAPTMRAILQDQLKPIGTVDEKSVTLLPSTISDADLHRITQLLDITHLLDHTFVTLSNGETRRMLLAKSLLKNPEVLLLDNPYSGLDVHSRSILTKALGDLSASGVMIILVTTPSEIPDCITHVLELSQGKIRFQFTLAEYKSKNQLLNSGSTTPVLSRVDELGDPHFTDFKIAIDLRQVTVSYHGEKILNQVNWTVKKGEKWALSGANGSGKSTLLSIITADNPQRFANDFDLFDQKRGGIGASIWDIKQKIGHVSPELHLYFPGQTSVYKTIASGYFDATGVFFKKLNDTQKQRVDEVAELLHVHHLLEKEFNHLSKGEQRMVLLARALVKNPPLLILDEPCQGLDEEAMTYFKSVVDAVCSTSNRTLIYVSHYENEIPSCITNRIRLNQGKVVELQ
jgi:molybdate transport system ATP-binding protein